MIHLRLVLSHPLFCIVTHLYHNEKALPRAKSIICYCKFVGSHRQKTFLFLKKENKSERSEEHTSELQSRFDLVCRLLLEKKKNQTPATTKQCRRQYRIVT